MVSRRGFIKVGTATLAALHMGCLWAADPEVIADSGRSFYFLTKQDRSLLVALTPVVLAEALPTATDEAKQATIEVVRGLDMNLTLLPVGSQAEMRQFLDLLENQLLPDWKDPAVVEQFLLHTQAADSTSPEAQMLRVGTMGLMQLTLGSWYANPRSWPATGYAGPPLLY